MGAADHQSPKWHSHKPKLRPRASQTLALGMGEDPAVLLAAHKAQEAPEDQEEEIQGDPADLLAAHQAQEAPEVQEVEEKGLPVYPEVPIPQGAATLTTTPTPVVEGIQPGSLTTLFQPSERRKR